MSKATQSDTPIETVIIIWKQPNAEPDFFNMLDSYNGIRVYKRDCYDRRLHLGKDESLPYFDDPDKAIAWMEANPGEQIQLKTRAARLLYPGEPLARFY